METLVKSGADVNSRRMKDGWTPLYLACIFGYTYKAKYLVDSGADVLLGDNLGWTPEDCEAVVTVVTERTASSETEGAEMEKILVHKAYNLLSH